MTMLTRFDPFREAMSLRSAIDQLFEQSIVPSAYKMSGLNCPMDVLEKEQGYEVHALLPGVKAEDIELTIHDGVMTLKGKTQPWYQDEQKGQWLLREIGTGTFERRLTFPKGVNADLVQTEFENGHLTVFIPFSEVSRPRKISITPVKEKQMVEAGA